MIPVGWASGVALERLRLAARDRRRPPRPKVQRATSALDHNNDRSYAAAPERHTRI